jgi:RsmE family RNA methyltransferase
LNIILFSPAEVQLPLSRSDPRARHILDVLRRQPGDTFDAGLIDGPRGKGTVVAADRTKLKLTFAWSGPPPPLSPIHLILGLPRPATARDVLREATSLGVAALHFVRTDKGEPSYATSSLWADESWRDCVLAGAAQAFCTRLPAVTHGNSLADAIAALPAQPPAGSTGQQRNLRLALDNYESPAALATTDLTGADSVALALGAERGWSAGERDLLRARGFTFVHLGARVLRTETACVAAISLVKARLGWF